MTLAVSGSVRFTGLSRGRPGCADKAGVGRCPMPRPAFLALLNEHIPLPVEVTRRDGEVVALAEVRRP